MVDETKKIEHAGPDRRDVLVPCHEEVSGGSRLHCRLDREILRELARCFARAAVDEMLLSEERGAREGERSPGTRASGEPQHIDGGLR